MDINADAILKIAVAFPPFLFALCFHEYAHGWAAKKFGDKTAEYMGRLTMNPVAHMDPVGTLVLPIMGMAMGGFIFGWAKPVPVNPRNLSKPNEQMFWIAFAGPLSNVLLGFLGAFALILLAYFTHGNPSADVFVQMLRFFVTINAMLAVFNMIPLHPLDGGKVLARFLPDEINQKLEDVQMYSSMILLGLLFLGGFRILMIPISFLDSLFLTVAQGVLSLFL